MLWNQKCIRAIVLARLILPLATLLLLHTTSVAALQPAAPPPASHYTTAASIPDPPPLPAEDVYVPSIVDDLLLTAFRWTLQQQSNAPKSNLPGFSGMVEELLDFRRIYGLEEQERVSYQTMVALSGPIPFIYKHVFSQRDYSPAVLAWFAKHLLPFLVGDMVLTTRDDCGNNNDNNTAKAAGGGGGGGVLVQHCRVLAGTHCKGICSKMCKVPTQRFFQEQWGVPLTMSPNFETGQCQLVFGKTPLPVDQDPTLPQGCITRCPMFATSNMHTANTKDMC